MSKIYRVITFMLLVVPISKSDLNNSAVAFNMFIKSVCYFGPYKEHELLVVCRPSDKTLGENVLTAFSRLFKTSNLFVFEDEGPSGWPEGPNSYWKRTIEYLKENNNKLPWFWMEADCTPLKSKWLDLLEKEYKKSKQPCFGLIMDTMTTTTNGYRVTIAKHLQGTAVYPANFHEITTIWEYTDVLKTAFDVITQWEVIPQTENTDLVVQGFQTKNYRIRFNSDLNKEVLQGEDVGKLTVQGVEGYNYPITKRGLVHHGCKDGTLAQAIMDNNNQKYLI